MGDHYGGAFNATCLCTFSGLKCSFFNTVLPEQLTHLHLFTEDTEQDTPAGHNLCTMTTLLQDNLPFKKVLSTQ